MKKYIKSTLLMLCGLVLLTACSDDNDSNPVLGEPTAFVLNPSPLENVTVDLAKSSVITLTCSQPDYGYPAATTYNLWIATEADMSNKVYFEVNSKTPTLELDAATLASTLTDMMVGQGKTEEDFPMTLEVYFQAEAVVTATTGDVVESTRIKSNVVSLKHVNLEFSLPPVQTPDVLYITGNFCGWSWDKALTMVLSYDESDTAEEYRKLLWHLVYIDESGIKFNANTAWDGGEVGYAGITINPASELGDEIVDGGGNIASSKPGWYLMIVKCVVEGRDIKYDVTFNKPEVWIMGTITPAAAWAEKEEGCMFEVPATADGEFISPAFTNDVSGDGGARAYVMLPGHKWWHSEFIVGLDGKKISYRGTGGDQDRVDGKAGQKFYLNFTTDTGEIK